MDHNRNQLRQNIGKKFEFFPIPTRNSASGQCETDKNLWVLRREADDQKGVEFLNLFGDYNSLVLDPLKIKNFDEPDALILEDRLFLMVRLYLMTRGQTLPVYLKTSLVMLLERADQTGIIHITHTNPTNIATLQLAVSNTGEQTVRDYRVERPRALENNFTPSIEERS